jgi:hypothetical protein
MERIDFGTSAASFDFDGDGIVNARIGGLLVPANAGALSALLLRAGADQDAPGVLCSVEKALVALPPIDPRHYGYVPPPLRSVPVAVVVSPEQFGVYENVALAAAATGAIRRAFLSREQAQAWLREQVRALKANRVWRTGHR